MTQRKIICAKCGNETVGTGPRTKYCPDCATQIRIGNQNRRRSGGLKDGAPHTKHITCEICGKDVVVSTKAARARYCPECARKQKQREGWLIGELPEKKKKKPRVSQIENLNAAARKAGMSYGKYVAMLAMKKGKKVRA